MSQRSNTRQHNGRETPNVLPADRHCPWENPLPAIFLRQVFRLAIVLFCAGTSSSVFACPAGQYQVCMVACFCAPGSEEEAGTIFDDMNQMAASGLQNWIVQSQIGRAHV